MATWQSYLESCQKIDEAVSDQNASGCLLIGQQWIADWTFPYVWMSQGDIGFAVNITERKRVEEHRRLLMTELDHRVRNTLAAVQSMARHSLGEGERVDAFLARLAAFAQTHTLLAQGRWRGAGLRALVGAALEAYDGRVHLDGPDELMQPRATQALGMVLHELATNAAKYGA